MKAEDLVALAAAHGIDLVGTARLGGKPKGTRTRSRRRFGVTTVILEPPPDSRARGKSSEPFDRPAWTVAELGQAAQGVESLHFMAACFAYAGDRSVYWKLWDALHSTACRLRVRNNWPAQIRTVSGDTEFYLAELAQLVLGEDMYPHDFRAHPELYAICMNVNRHVWNHQLFERFDALKLRYLTWIAIAMRTMQPRLAETSEESDDVVAERTQRTSTVPGKLAAAMA